MDQVEIFNKEEILINPSFTEHHGINRTRISFLIVDLDLNDFANEEKMKSSIGESIERNLKEDQRIHRWKSNCTMDK